MFKSYYILKKKKTKTKLDTQTKFINMWIEKSVQYMGNFNKKIFIYNT